MDTSSASPVTDTQTIHASSVAIGDAGALIIGPSGSGKSRLALELLSMGALLVADDLTVVHASGKEIRVSAPDSFRGLIEVRGVGLLGAMCQPSAALEVVVDLEQEETHRLPPRRTVSLLGENFPVIFGANVPCLAASVRQFLNFRRAE